MKKTPFYENHIEYNGKIVDFAGYKMPVQYSEGIIKEVMKVRESVGVFDVSHMGEVEVIGSDALLFVENITTNNVAELNENQVHYTTMCLSDGGIIDDLLVYKKEKSYFLVINAANIEKDFSWIQEKSKKWNVNVENISSQIAQLAVQGPDAQKVIQKLTNQDIDEIKYYYFRETELAGKKVLLSRTGYTGEDGFEIYLNSENTGNLWDDIFQAGEKFKIAPCGLASRDILRLEVCLCLYGNDITEETNPLEAGLKWLVKFDTDFIGKESLLKQKEEKIKRKFVPFILDGRQVARKGFKIFSGDEEIGFVTSGAYSPSIEKSIGMGYINRGFFKVNTDIEIQIRNKRVKAKVIKSPFYKDGTHL